jgi:hypothetical protein
MESQTDICKEILDDFLDRWTVEAVKKMTLDQYVSVANPDTFCQWVETRTIKLGNIKGAPSIKFGIYKRDSRNKNKKPKNYDNDEEYSWRKSFNANTRKEAFEIVKNEIIKIIEYANVDNLEAIDDSKLDDIFKWKVAFLYSGGRIIPIFKRDWLEKIAERFGLQKNSPYSLIHRKLISRKPSYRSIYEYASKFWGEFGGNKKPNTQIKATRIIRKAVTWKNTETQTRQAASSYIATQKHNILQEALKNKLIEKFGKENVRMEENLVDIKVFQPDKIYFYEIKSSAYASDCIREALGQILLYAHSDNDERPKQLIIAGQYKPNDSDISFINYVKKILNLNFSYESIDL